MPHLMVIFLLLFLYVSFSLFFRCSGQVEFGFAGGARAERGRSAGGARAERGWSAGGARKRSDENFVMVLFALCKTTGGNGFAGGARAERGRSTGGARAERGRSAGGARAERASEATRLSL